ncbi:hypothetical protein KOI35_43110 [Actinoplanes bogorensis]|uniref:Uncharacterized protein n=1 Tax=Paractinoplanes bogorensis TaxID=1610840 RepID=A0ABS5Z3N7_9ACTN|nr:hypothetical protein [Actinoplanes bogorensis]MBU2670314.1 hypothetical protein [Actinoplanes bogorensis]
MTTSNDARLRELAGRGHLGRLNEAERERLRPAAYELAYRIVYDVVIRRVARGRGHHACAAGLHRMRECCLDGYYDDLEATVDRLLTSTERIGDLEAWLAKRAKGAAIDAYRRRRGATGAPQRPRMTKALSRGLGHDPWLCDLALKILDWVGIPAGLGATVWPVDSWAADRAARTGDHHGSTPARVVADVDRVLGVMRRRPDWFHRHVERPLGRKTAPVGGCPGEGPGDPRPLLADPGDADEARVRELAAAAVEAIRAGLGRGEDAAAAVETVLSELFLGGTGADQIGRMPGHGEVTERVSVLLGDRVAFAALVQRILPIVDGSAG